MNDAALERYFEEAQSWERDRVATAERGSRVAWRVAAAGWACAMMSGASLALLVPLKRVEPFLIRVDRSTGVVDTVPIYAGSATQPQAVTRYFLDHYITTCERFNFSTAESDYAECGAFQTPRENQAWYALWSRSNPASPLNRYKDGRTVRADVESISFLTPVDGAQRLAQVRYRTLTRQADGANRAVENFIATIRYTYAAPSADAKLRLWNPLGFKIVALSIEPEFLPRSRDAGGPAPGGVAP